MRHARKREREACKRERVRERERERERLTLVLGPSIILGASLNLDSPRLRSLDISLGGLLEETVDLELVSVRGGLGAGLHGGGDLVELILREREREGERERGRGKREREEREKNGE